MGIVRDFKEDNAGYRLRHQIVCFFSPKVWLRLHKWRKQRADRGWSNRDTWGAGDHIAKMTAEMLQHLNDHTYVDWPEWFKLNVKEEGKGAYKSLPAVVKDIQAYLDFTETSWADDLDSKHNGDPQKFHVDWYDQKGKKLTDAAIKYRINKWSEQHNKLYKKAQKAMGFFARHFSSFWD